MSNVEYKPAEKLQIRLVRPDRNSPWGFRLQGGIDFNTPLSIQSRASLAFYNVFQVAVRHGMHLSLCCVNQSVPDNANGN
ncbi:PDZ and LIM domain protein 3 [Biomphalaria glabrata]|nr:PDZ and LIM domain protein 3 [Biomphalaria glabrata]